MKVILNYLPLPSRGQTLLLIAENSSIVDARSFISFNTGPRFKWNQSFITGGQTLSRKSRVRHSKRKSSHDRRRRRVRPLQLRRVRHLGDERSQSCQGVNVIKKFVCKLRIFVIS